MSRNEKKYFVIYMLVKSLYSASGTMNAEELRNHPRPPSSPQKNRTLRPSREEQKMFIPKIPREGTTLESVNNDDSEHRYNCCCRAVPMSDRRVLIFSASLSISLIVIVFSCYQLVNLVDCHSQNTYISLLSLVIGIWLKSPI